MTFVILLSFINALIAAFLSYSLLFTQNGVFDIIIFILVNAVTIGLLVAAILKRKTEDKSAFKTLLAINVIISILLILLFLYLSISKVVVSQPVFDPADIEILTD